MRAVPSIAVIPALLIVPALAAAGVLTAPSIASARGEILLSRPMAMGGAYTAAGAGNGAIYSNPAGIARYRVYSVEASYLRLDEDNTLHLSVVDTKTQPIGVGIGYALTPGDTDTHDGRLSLAYPAVPNRLFAGIGLHYVFGDAPDGEGNAQAFAIDTGATIHLGAGVLVGGMIRNLSKDPAHADTASRGYSFGLGWEGPVTLAFDLDLDPSEEGPARFGYHSGMELPLGTEMQLRAGWNNDRSEPSHHYISGGFGVISQSGAFEMAYRQRVDVDGDRLFGISLKVFM